MPNDSFFFEDDLETAERARRRGNRLLERPFQPTPLEAILGGVGRQEREAVRQKQARDRLQTIASTPRPAGPLPLMPNGEVFDENTVTSARELGNPRDNPGIPQLVMGRVMVASPAGRVRVLPEPGEDPAVVDRFRPQSLLPGAPTLNSSTKRASRASAGMRGAADRLRLLENNEGNALLRPLINSRRRLMNALENLSKMKIEKSVGERLGETRRDFGEFFMRDIAPIIERNIGPVIESVDAVFDIAAYTVRSGANAGLKSLEQDLPITRDEDRTLFELIDDISDSASLPQLATAVARAAREFVGASARHLAERSGMTEKEADQIEDAAESLAQDFLFVALSKRRGIDLRTGATALNSRRALQEKSKSM